MHYFNDDDDEFQSFTAMAMILRTCDTHQSTFRRGSEGKKGRTYDSADEIWLIDRLLLSYQYSARRRAGEERTAVVTTPVETAKTPRSIHRLTTSPTTPRPNQRGTTSSINAYTALGATYNAISRRRRLFSMRTLSPQRAEATPAQRPESKSWEVGRWGKRIGGSRVRTRQTLRSRFVS